MSWMDSWSRPSKSQATPPPFYLTHGDTVPYCQTCGRVIGQRRATNSKTAATEVKYCSDRCKSHKPSTTPGSLDRRIEDALSALLEGTELTTPEGIEPNAPASYVKADHRPKKGDPRIVVKLSEVETAVFGNQKDPEAVYGRRKNRRARFIPGSEEWKSVDMEEPMAVPSAGDDLDTADSQSGGSDANPSSGISAIDHVRAPQAQSEVNFSVGGERGWAEKIEETPEMLAKRREGQKRAMEKELVKSAARRAVIFGLPVDARPAQASGRRTKGRRLSQIGQIETMRRKCEALMNGKVVEPSFAKGDWSIRWREEWPLHA